MGWKQFPFLGLVKMVKCKSTLPWGDKVGMEIVTLGLVEMVKCKSKAPSWALSYHVFALIAT